MADLLLPPRLRQGDAVGIATPSGGVRTPGRLARGADALAALGFRPVIGPLATACRRTVADRSAEINGFLNDPEIRAVFCSIGGYTSNGVLDSIDFAALRHDPKPLIGYSDITALLLGAFTQAGVVTYHGPTVLAELGEYPEPLAYTAAHLLRATMSAQPLGVLQPAPEWTDEFLAWDSADDRLRRPRRSTGWTGLCPGRGEGPLLGGNLETLCALAGTRYLPSFAGAVLVCETSSANLERIERDLSHLAMLGAFDDLAGVLFGRSFRVPAGFAEQMDDLLRDRFGRYAVPVLAGVDLGHCDPMLTLPLGLRARVDADTRSLEVVDAPVE